MLFLLCCDPVTDEEYETLLELAYEAWLEMWARTQEAEQTGAE